MEAIYDPAWDATKAVKMSPKVEGRPEQALLDADSDTTNIAGKTILITGGASGFGAAFAKHWARHGAHIVIGDINDGGGEAVVAGLRALPGSSGHHHYQHCDVIRWEDQVALFKAAAAVSPTGGIDIVVANAGLVEAESAVTGKGFENPVALDSDRPPPPPLTVLKVNLTGAMYTTHLALFWLPKNGSRPDGTPRDRLLVLLSSIAGVSPIPGQPEYTASKHGLLGLFRSLRGSTWRHDVRCNLIAPYFVNTPILPKRALFFTAGGPMAEVEDVVDATTRLVADETIRGRGLLVGPKMKAVDVDGELELVIDEKTLKNQQGQAQTRAVWDIYANDYEAVELFVWRYIGALHLVVKIKGFIALIKDVLEIFRMDKK